MKQEKSKLVVKIDENIEIWLDSRSYQVRIGREISYFPTLDMCFQYIFEEKVKAVLSKNSKKEMKEIASLIVQVRKEILKILEPFVQLEEKSQ